MARTADQVNRDTLGNLMAQIVSMTAEIEALKEALEQARKPEGQ